jgi:hypothetical protein
MSYEQIEQRLSQHGHLLLVWMTDLHSSVNTGRYFHFVATFGGSWVRWAHGDVFETDQASLNELSELGLLRQTVDGSNPEFEVRQEAVLFVQWLRIRGGAVRAVERETLRFLNDDKFNTMYPTVAHHLAEASNLLWSPDATSESAVVEVGSHLRSALQSIVSSVAGGNPEKVNENIRRWAPTVTADREATLLMDMVEHAYGCCQRLTHIRDESAKGLPVRSHGEIRRIAFLTIVVCYELSALAADVLPNS